MSGSFTVTRECPINVTLGETHEGWNLNALTN